MEFIGSTIFDLPQPPSSESSPLHPSSDETARMVDSFLEQSLPQLIKAVQGHKVQHVLVCSDSLPSNLREQLQSTAARFPFLLYLERDNFIDPVDLRREAIGFRLPSTSTFARYCLAPNDVVSLGYFEILTKYAGPEYAGMRLKLLGGLDGYCVTESAIIVQKASLPFSEAGSIDILATAEANAGILLPGSSSRRAAEESPEILDGATHTHLSLRPGRTAALWKDPGSETNSTHLVDAERRDLVRQEFPTFRNSLHFHTRIPLFSLFDLATDRLKVDFPHPLQSFSLLFTTAAEDNINSDELIVSYQLVDTDGNTIPADVDLKGIGRVSAPDIGHCFIPEISGGTPTVLKHVQPPTGVLCQGVTFIRRRGNDGKMEILDGEITFRLKP